jgi:Fungal protein of unknown function (DUF1752)
MAEVLPAPNDSSYYSSSSSLRRNNSTSSLANASGPTSSYSKRIKPHVQTYNQPRTSPSGTWSTPPSPQTAEESFSSAASFSSSSSSTVSLDSKCYMEVEDVEDQLNFPSYDTYGYIVKDEDLTESARQENDTSHMTSSASATPSTVDFSSVPDTPELSLTAIDDTAVQSHPSRHIDYLSHEWKEEDIRASWRYMISKRKHYKEGARLENASWRSWTKARLNLKTVSPEKLNWLVLQSPTLRNRSSRCVRNDHDYADNFQAERL